MWKRLSIGLLLVFLCGCFKTKDELTINADGSGKVRLETHSSVPPELSAGLGMEERMGGVGGAVMYPPTSESEAQKFFPGKDFTVTTKQEKSDNGEVTTVIEATFKDINALLASPYGRAHQLSVKLENGTLVVNGLSGMEAIARLAEMKDDGDMGFSAMMPGLADMRKKKDEMRDEFRVTLPNTITTANGAHEEKTASWIVERAKCKDADEFAKQLGSTLEARCLADGLKLAPVTPTRLGLRSFKELAEGAGTDKQASFDTNKIAAAAKFVPYGLQVTRSLDLSGESGSHESGAQLIGAVVLPTELAPQRWDEARLDEVVDGKGNNLKADNSAEGQMFAMRTRLSGMENGDAGENTNGLQRRLVSFSFRPPDWKVNEIGRIKGSITARYFSGSQVVKLTNAIPTKWFMDVKAMRNGSFGHFDTSEKSLNNPRLADLGLLLSVQTAMVESEMTILTLMAKGKQAVLTDAQVFDAEGRPWPTFLQSQSGGEDGEGGACQIMVAGKPPAPLSLALLVSGGGVTVEVPIALEHVPVNGK
jgi:hypothetical protein